ncbi:c-type cytochrome [Tunturiibacter gelidoferens]|uniref:Cytochrome c oxidase cbb3-type subunit 3/ubiquinol-cytochrome c reductase cytochrome c subunit n=1 Tax=Tunturiibacter gelidiferens TaxID=3069689 RepID=A0ACC5NY33_9BACT|nr:cytochrome c [Edaphobacter lichenicola]MBB5339518.1 cytochrome c oxidase cbb3-type subunit 3/ubiquinol-cytochrome c reductase cytochrome c subunit [Edaphobacter lichenicola]
MRSAPHRLAVFGTLMLSAVCITTTGCSRIPGRPGPGPEVVRPDEVLDFATLYKQNCAACHGNNGKNGAAISLANPVYLAVAGEQTIHQTIAQGVPGGLMPAFAKASGGSLTDKQVAILGQSIVQQWSASDQLAGTTLPPYAATLQGDANRGQQAYSAACARCHGADGEGTSADSKTSDPKATAGKLGSIVNPSYLALISDQDLRSIVIAGRPDEGMPDWRSDSAQPLNDQQITDIIAWLASKRVAEPGQPYHSH